MRIAHFPRDVSLTATTSLHTILRPDPQINFDKSTAFENVWPGLKQYLRVCGQAYSGL